MKVGIQVTIDGRPGRQAPWARDLAQTIEGLGFHSLWLGDHIVEFAAYDSRHPYRESGRHPSTERGTPGRYEPLTMLAAMAGWTERLRLGTAVLLLTERNPVLTAMMVSTLDHLAGGRLDLGVGVGWLREEHEALGVPFEDRGRRCNEYLEAMRCLWTDDVSSFSGEYVSFTDVLAFPKPLSRPHPPIFVGGSSPPALRRAVAHGDGWIPAFLEGDALRAHVDELRAQAHQAGRALDEFQITPMYVFDSIEPHAQQQKAEYHLQDCGELGLPGVIFKPRFDESTYESVLTALAELLP